MHIILSFWKYLRFMSWPRVYSPFKMIGLWQACFAGNTLVSNIHEIKSSRYNQKKKNQWPVQVTQRRYYNLWGRLGSSGGSRISRRCQFQRRGWQPIIWPIFSRNYMKMKEIGLKGRVSLSPPIVCALFPWKNINFNLYGINLDTFTHVSQLTINT